VVVNVLTQFEGVDQLRYILVAFWTTTTGNEKKLSTFERKVREKYTGPSRILSFEYEKVVDMNSQNDFAENRNTVKVL